jgi:MFS family permease
MTLSAIRARWAVFTIFLLHGMVAGSWVPHIPLAKERLGVGPGVFGLALLALAGGAVFAMPIAGAMINKYGSAKVTAVTGVMFCLAVFGPVLAPTLPLFILCGVLMGISMGSMDVAMNSHGIAVEKALTKPTMSIFHGAFSVGATLGTFAGAYLLRFLPPAIEIACLSAICLSLHIASINYLLPASVDKGLSGSHFAWPTKATIGLGLLCFLALMIEGSVMDWAAILMREKFLLEAGFAALAFGFYQTGMAVSRFTGDWMRQKFGAVQLVATSSLLAAIGTAAALAAPTPVLALVAFVFAGLGIGNAAPVLFAGGGRLEPDAPGRGIAAVTTLGYTGFLAGPPMIGLAAEFVGLNWALALTVPACLIIAAGARMVRSADTY